MKSFLRLSLGLFLIMASSAVLLYTDKGSQRTGPGSSDSGPRDERASSRSRSFNMSLNPSWKKRPGA